MPLIFYIFTCVGWDPYSKYKCFGSGSGSRGLKKVKNVKELQHILLFSSLNNILFFNWLILIRESYNYKVILFFVQIVLRNSLDPDPDLRSSWYGLKFLAGSGFNWIWIWNTAKYGQSSWLKYGSNLDPDPQHCF